MTDQPVETVARITTCESLLDKLYRDRDVLRTARESKVPRGELREHAEAIVARKLIEQILVQRAILDKEGQRSGFVLEEPVHPDVALIDGPGTKLEPARCSSRGVPGEDRARIRGNRVDAAARFAPVTVDMPEFIAELLESYRLGQSINLSLEMTHLSSR